MFEENCYRLLLTLFKIPDGVRMVFIRTLSGIQAVSLRRQCRCSGYGSIEI